MRKVGALSAVLLGWVSLSLAETGRNFSVDDALRIRELSEPRISPDGKWVAFVVTVKDSDEDLSNSDLYMAPFVGGESVRLTRSPRKEWYPRWSPEGKFLAFLSERGKGKNQVWFLDRRGGEPFQVTSLEGGVESFEWSPDGTRLALVSKDPDRKEDLGDQTNPSHGKEQTDPKKTKPPTVIQRLQFKRDGTGYLTDRYDHLYVFDISQHKTRQLTSGPYDDSAPAWSPDGKWLAFVSNRTPNPDSNQNTDIFLVPTDGEEVRQMTRNPGQDTSPSWSPDGKLIAYIAVLNPQLIWYGAKYLAVVGVNGGEPAVLTSSLDRNVQQPSFSADGTSIAFLLEDGASQHLCRIPVAGGKLERLVAVESKIESFHRAPRGRFVILQSRSDLPAELFGFGKSRQLNQITFLNQEVLSEVRLGKIRTIRFNSQDGTEVEGFVTTPPGHEAGRNYPTVLWIHGGPVGQFSHSFSPLWQVLAGAGYVVVAANPRGSSGYGESFCRAIWADWGNKDYEDVMGAVNHVIELGYADPERLGVGGWSYGGILTNYVITKTDRFKAAISGASETNYIACYGTDHYQYEWETELGLPWENRELYLKLSPLSYVKKIVTPTLILCGERDFNVPLNQSEQLYQSLRRLGTDTMLIVYPGESHGIRKPSYLKDRYQRYLAWLDRFLKD